MKMTRQQRNQLAILGAAVLDAEACKSSVERLTPAMFEEGPLRELFAAIRDLMAEGAGVDVLTLENRLGSGYRQLIASAAETVPTLSHVQDYETLVLEDYRRRLLQGQLAALAADESSSDALCSRLQKALDQQNAIRSAALDESARSFDEVLDEFEANLTAPSALLRLNWRDVDYYGLFERTNVVVIAGRPGGGKTDFAITLAARFSRQYRVYYLVMEDTRKKLMARVVSRVTRIDAGRIRDRNLTGAERDSIHNVVAALKQHHNMVLDDGDHMTVEDVRAKILRHKPDIVFVDHIGLLAGTDPKMEEKERLAEITRELKLMAKNMNIVVVELVQLNRITDRSGGVRAAKLSDLRGSGTIEADTNCAIYVESTPNEDGGEELHGADAYKDVPIRVVKNRDGATGRFSMRWQPQYHSWEPTPSPEDDFREVPGGLPESVQQRFDIQDSLENDGRYAR